MSFALPAPNAVLGLSMEDGSEIKLRRYGNPGGVRLYMSHGNGFAVDGYFAFWSLFLRDFEVVLFDFRNHGQNEPSDPSRHTYAQMARDLDRVAEGVEAAFGRKPRVGVFHSMSGRAAMKHAIEIAWRWDALALFDPPNVPPPAHRVYEPMRKFETRLSAWARARRAHFPTPAELTAEYLSSRATANWVPGTHELMAQAVLRPDPGGGFALVCAPALEASIYDEAMTLNLWPQAASFAGPVKLIGADPDLAGGPPTGLANRALAEENGYDYAFVPGAGHLLQVEKPASCAEILASFLAAHRLGR